GHVVYRFRLLALAALVCFAVVLSGPARAQKGDKSDKSNKSDKTDKADKPASPPPPETIVVVDSLAKALEMAPDLYLLMPDSYRSIQEQLARLKLLERPAVQTPTKLVLKGKIDGGLVLLTAQYEFQIDKPGTIVRLGGSPAQATGVSLDGKTPRLLAGRNGAKGAEEGFSVQIDKVSDEDKPPQLTLDLVLPLATRGGGQGFSIDLPRAPTTKIEIALPAGSRDVRANGKALTGPSLKGNQTSLWAGLSDRLELDWKPAAAVAAAAVLTADGVVNVRLDKK